MSNPNNQDLRFDVEDEDLRIEFEDDDCDLWEDDGQPSEHDEWQDYYGGDEDYSGDCEPLWNEW